MNSNPLPTELIRTLTKMIDTVFAGAPTVQAAPGVRTSSVDISSSQAFVETIDEYLKQHPGNVELLLAKSSALRTLIQMKSAEDVIDEILIGDPEQFDARLIKEEWDTWDTWPHLLQLPPCSEGMNELSPVLQEGIASGRCVHLIRDGVKIGVAFVHDVSQIRFDRGLTQAMRCKWEFVPAESPHGRIVAHYPLVEDNPASPYRQEFFLNGDRPQKAVGLSGYWLLQRLARVDSGFIVLAKGDRVQYSRRFVFSEQLRARLNEIAVSLVNDPKPVRTIEGFQRAIQWHMDHFDFTSVKF